MHRPPRYHRSVSCGPVVFSLECSVSAIQNQLIYFDNVASVLLPSLGSVLVAISLVVLHGTPEQHGHEPANSGVPVPVWKVVWDQRQRSRTRRPLTWITEMHKSRSSSVLNATARLENEGGHQLREHRCAQHLFDVASRQDPFRDRKPQVVTRIEALSASRHMKKQASLRLRMKQTKTGRQDQARQMSCLHRSGTEPLPYQ